MKIIRTDNYGREHISDVLVATGVGEVEGKIMVKALNDHVGSHSSDFYVLVEDDKPIYKFIP